MGGVQENGHLGVVGRGASCFPQIPEPAREQRTVRRSGRRTCPKVFTGGWNRSNHWKGGFSLLPRSQPLVPSGRSLEQEAYFVNTTLSKGGMVASGRHL